MFLDPSKVYLMQDSCVDAVIVLNVDYDGTINSYILLTIDKFRIDLQNPSKACHNITYVWQNLLTSAKTCYLKKLVD